uniref:Uncharacterized protein n=1 Tax=Aegilops tauschii subsp. strangulata TaxID=200361 RepID=A0A453C7F6_AEGTS
MRCPGHPHIERRVEGFGPVDFPAPPPPPPSSSGACLGGVPPESGLEPLALPTSRLLMAVGHDYYKKSEDESFYFTWRSVHLYVGCSRRIMGGYIFSGGDLLLGCL